MEWPPVCHVIRVFRFRAVVSSSTSPQFVRKQTHGGSPAHASLLTPSDQRMLDLRVGVHAHHIHVASQLLGLRTRNAVSYTHLDVYKRQGFGCSPIKAARELGSERRETVWSLSSALVGILRRPAHSTRGPGWTDLWYAGCRASGMAGWLRSGGITAESI